MDEIIARIKAKSIVLNQSLDGTDKEDLLDMVIESVVDRTLIFTNRDAYVAAYEAAIADLDEDEELDPCVTVPIPKPLETVLAQIVVKSFRSISNENAAINGRVTRVVDKGQEVNFSDKAMNFFASGNDSEIFSGAETLLRRYLLPKTIASRSY